jgi:hypothetical protein
MEKIVVLTHKQGDENLVNCLRMLFPECLIEVRENKQKARNKNTISSASKNDIVKKIHF